GRRRTARARAPMDGGAGGGGGREPADRADAGGAAGGERARRADVGQRANGVRRRALVRARAADPPAADPRLLGLLGRPDSDRTGDSSGGWVVRAEPVPPARRAVKWLWACEPSRCLRRGER